MARKDDGTTALFIAAQKGRTAVARRLLQAGASHAVTNAHGVTPLLVSCFCGRFGCVQLLSSYGAARECVLP